ncbi:MAG TPA: hypothetical protein VMR14_16320 [Streptosporangiaceae bacterium]|nr:hypothetical protein [Streptosporangiaceae bacterium]
MTEEQLAARVDRAGLITRGAGTRERDIDVVLVTGAGASQAFGVNDTLMSLMNDWSDHLVRKLAQRNGYLQATGLRRGMGGEDFEARLGKFLQDVEAFRRVSDLLDPSVKFGDFGPGTQNMSARGVDGAVAQPGRASLRPDHHADPRVLVRTLRRRGR